MNQPTAKTFGTDQVLLYDVAPWNGLGFGVANFGDNLRTQNVVWWRLASEIGKTQLGIMTHVDARREQYPSVNTLIRMGKILNRIKTVLLARQRAASDIRLEPGHMTPAPMDWMIHPVPYFSGSIVVNPWMFEYNHLCMCALTNIFQNSDNNLALEMTAESSADIWQYFERVTELIAGELLMLSKAVYKADDFLFTTELFAKYAPADFLPRNEALSQPVGNDTGFTEDDLRPLKNGIPANQIVALLSRYSVSKYDNNPLQPQGNVIQEPAMPGTSDRSALAPIL
jgi:hypothetical protein